MKELKAGDKFEFEGFEWVVLNQKATEGGVLAMMTSAWNGKEHPFDEKGCNNWKESSLKKKLEEELLPVLGKENLLDHTVNLVDMYTMDNERTQRPACESERHSELQLRGRHAWSGTGLRNQKILNRADRCGRASGMRKENPGTGRFSGRNRRTARLRKHLKRGGGAGRDDRRLRKVGSPVIR